MKTTTFLALAAVGKLAAAHATFQEILVNGVSQGTTGVRGTSNSNNPIYSDATSLASDMMICKGGAEVAGQVEVASGDKISLQWHHNNPSSGSSDADEPIAASHKGPIIVWVAKADTEGKGNAWVKIWESGLSDGTWAVDTFRTNAGKIDVTLPDLAAGDYLIRSEIIALHEANTEGKAQFYNGCGQITVTSSGTLSITDGADIQSVYTPTDPGVLFNIYSGATSYPIPGPAVSAGFGSGAATTAATSTQVATTPASSKAATSAVSTKAVTSAATSAASSKAVTSAATSAASTKAATPAASTKAATSAAPQPTTLQTVVKTTSEAATSTKASTSGNLPKWYQCGGKGWTGQTACVSGTTCQKQNDYYYQCL